MADPKSYEYRDSDGDKLMFDPIDCEASNVIVTTSSGGTGIPARRFPEVIAGLYGAAGLEAPIILERPDGGTDDWDVGGEIYADAGHVEIEIHGDYAPGPARRLAAFIAHTADQAETSAAEADVARVAKVIQDADDTRLPAVARRDGQTNFYEALARSLLRTHTVTPREGE